MQEQTQDTTPVNEDLVAMYWAGNRSSDARAVAPLSDVIGRGAREGGLIIKGDPRGGDGGLRAINAKYVADIRRAHDDPEGAVRDAVRDWRRSYYGRNLDVLTRLVQAAEKSGWDPAESEKVIDYTKTVRFQAFTVAGFPPISERAFKDGSRKAERWRMGGGLEATTRLVGFDLDDVDDADETVQMLAGNPLTAVAFKSVGGNGVFLAARMPSAPADTAGWKLAYCYYSSICEELFGLKASIMDGAVKDASTRVRFLAHDPNAVYRPGAKLLPQIPAGWRHEPTPTRARSKPAAAPRQAPNGERAEAPRGQEAIDLITGAPGRAKRAHRKAENAMAPEALAERLRECLARTTDPEAVEAAGYKLDPTVRDDWVKACFAVKAAAWAASHGAEDRGKAHERAAYAEFARWGAVGGYTEADQRSQWDGGGGLDPSRIGPGTIYKFAKKERAGWASCRKGVAAIKHVEMPARLRAVMPKAPQHAAQAEIKLTTIADVADWLAVETRGRLRAVRDGGGKTVTWRVFGAPGSALPGWTEISADEITKAACAAGQYVYGAWKTDKKTGEVYWQPLREAAGQPRFGASAEALMRAGICMSDASEWDAEPRIIGLPGARVFDAVAWASRDMTEADLITRRLSAAPADDAAYAASKWAAISARIDQEHAGWLQLRMGAALLDVEGYDHCIFLNGAGGSGKTTFIRYLRGGFGGATGGAGYDGEVKAAEIDRSGQRSHESWKADLEGSRLLYAEDVGAGMRLDHGVVEGLLGTSIKAGRKHRDERKFSLNAPLVIGSETPPVIGTTNVRRYSMVGFPKNDGPADRSIRAAAFTEAECAAVIRWLLDGARKVIDAGMSLPDPPESMTAIFQTMVGSTFQAGMVEQFGRFAFVPVRDAIEYWRHLHSEEGVAPTSQQVMGSKMFGFAGWTPATKKFPWTKSNRAIAVGGAEPFTEADHRETVKQICG